MKLATLRRGGRDGTLVVVADDLSSTVAVPDIAPTLQAALDRWAEAKPALAAVANKLNNNVGDRMPLAIDDLAAPLPRAFQFLDGSVYLHHMEKARAARGAAMPPDYDTIPLMYQGASDRFLPPTGPAPFADAAHGIDFEGEIAVITDDVPLGVSAAAAVDHIALFVLLNDFSLRHLTPVELPKQFGFVQSKPLNALGPVAVTPDALGAAWDGRMPAITVRSTLNGRRFGAPNAAVDYWFTFAELIAHAARTRPLAAGTIIGSGTVSNADPATGHGCIAEARTAETIAHGAPRTPYMATGDTIRLEAFTPDGRTVFGAMTHQIVVPPT